MSTEAKKIYRVKIAPAEGVEKRTLEQDCARIVEGSAFDPGIFMQFCINMVYLLGTHEEKIEVTAPGGIETGRSNSRPLIDSKHHRAIHYKWSPNGLGAPVSMWSAPDWTTLPLREQGRVVERLMDPFTIESIHFTYSSEYDLATRESKHTTHALMARQLYYPEGYGPTVKSYFTEPIKPLSDKSEELERDKPLANSRLRSISKRVFRAWMAQ